MHKTDKLIHAVFGFEVSTLPLFVRPLFCGIHQDSSTEIENRKSEKEKRANELNAGPAP